MPSSSKRNRAKQRKAKKEKAAAEKIQQQQPQTTTTTTTTTVSGKEDVLCVHGLPSNPPGIVMDTFKYLVDAMYDKELMEGRVPLAFYDKLHANFPQLVNKSWQRSMLKEIILSHGAEALLINQVRIPKLCAMIILLLEYDEWGMQNVNASKLQKMNEKRNFSIQIRDLTGDRERTVAQFYTERIPCNCLQTMYMETRKDTKMGLCYFCDRESDFLDLKECMGCSIVHYCGRECQKQHWKEHKKQCKEYHTKQDWEKHKELCKASCIEIKDDDILCLVDNNNDDDDDDFVG